MKIVADYDFKENSYILGKSSGSIGIIKKVFSSYTKSEVNSSSIVELGWKKETGQLNNNLQRLHDNNYYQYFSYSLKSKVPYQKWDSSVEILNHTSGFKKFSDLIVESNPEDFSGLSTEQTLGTFEAKSDLDTIIDTNCISDFDLASEIVREIATSCKRATIDSTYLSEISPSARIEIGRAHV